MQKSNMNSNEGNEGRSNNNQLRSVLTRKEFTFPTSREQIDINIYRNQDGTLKNIDCVFHCIRTLFDDVNDYVIGLITPTSLSRYNLFIKSPVDLVIHETKMDNSGRYDYSNEKEIKKLSTEEVQSLKKKVVTGVVNFIELFAGYYGSKKKIVGEEGPSNRNAQLSNLLRFSKNAKIKFLEDILCLYIGMNAQTYFDVVSHIVMTGAFTIPSVVSTTGLYYSANKKLRGSSMLQGAVMKVSKDATFNLRSTEIHTADGLIVSSIRQIRIRFRAIKNDSLDDNFSFIPIGIVNEDEIPSISSSLSNRLPKLDTFRTRITPLLSDEEIYDRDQAPHRVLKYGADAALGRFSEEMIDAIQQDGITDALTNLNADSVMTIIKIIESLLKGKTVVSTWTQVDKYLIQPHQAEIMHKICDVDEFSVSQKELLCRYLWKFLAILDVPVCKGEKTYVDRLLSENAVDVLIEMSQAFLNIV